MTIATVYYSTTSAMTITLASLASDTTLVAGRQSTVVSNTTELAIDTLVGGMVTTGASPTASRQIEVWAFGSYDDTDYSGGAGASDANFTPDAKSLLKLLTVIPTVATSSKNYRWGPFSVAQAFGGVMPENWGVYVVHNTAVNLSASSSNHEVYYTPIAYKST